MRRAASDASKLGATVQVLFPLVVDLAIETSVCFRVSTSSSKTVEYNCGFRSTSWRINANDNKSNAAADKSNANAHSRPYYKVPKALPYYFCSEGVIRGAVVSTTQVAFHGQAIPTLIES